MAVFDKSKRWPSTSVKPGALGAADDDLPILCLPG